MTDEVLAAPATEAVTDVAIPAATQGGTKDDIAGQLKEALSGAQGDKPTVESSHDKMRRQIGEALEKEPALEGGKPDRARGPDGKFVTAQAGEPEASPLDTPPVEAVPTNAAPTSWRKEMQAKWSSVDPEIQSEILKRESDFLKGHEKLQGLKIHEPVLDFAAQVAPRLGTTGPQLVHQWAQAQEALLNPATAKQAIDFLIRQYRVDMGTPAQPRPVDGQPAAEPAWIDPGVAALKAELGELKTWRMLREQQEQQYFQQQAQQLQSAKMSLIDQFGSEKGADGQPLRPHLETVMPDMAAGIARLRAANPQISDQDALQQAYENAVWGNPQTRELVRQTTEIAKERERTEKARQRAQAATRGAVSPASASPQGPPASTPLKGDIRSQMQEALQRLTA